MSLYRSIIKQSFLTAWRHKYLWFFGLFATLLSSNFEIELVNRFTNRSVTLYDWERWRETGIFSGRVWSNLLEIAKTDGGSFISLIIVTLIIIALFCALIWISVVSQVALVSNTSKAAGIARKSTVAERRHDTSVGFQEGKKYFWPILLLNALVRVIVYGLALATLLPIMSLTSRGLGANLLYLLVFIVFLAIALALALIAKYAIAAIVLKRQSLKEAIVGSWHLFWNNWLVSLEMAFVLFALSIVVSFGIIVAVMLAAIPLVLLYFGSLALSSFILFVIVLILGIVISIGIVIIGGSILTVVQTTAWVSFYTQLTGKGVDSKLQRVLGDTLQ